MNKRDNKNQEKKEEARGASASSPESDTSDNAPQERAEKTETEQNPDFPTGTGNSFEPADIRVGIFVKLLAIFLSFSILPLVVLSALILISYRELFNQYGNVLQELSPEDFQLFQERLRDITVQSIITLGIFVALIVFASFFAGRYLVQPIKELLRGVRKLMQGDLGYRVNIETNDELGLLARNFNKMSERLKEAYEREKNLSEMKSGFISIAAHQLRTPLSAIKWTFKMLLSGDVGELTEEQKEFVKRGDDSNERMITLINDLLNVSRIEEGRFGYEFQDTDLIELVEGILEEEEVRIRQNNLEITFKKPKKDLPKLRVDPTKMRMAISNLIDNAIKYTLAGGRVEVGIRVRQKDALVYVKDSGIGIPPEQMANLFSKFFRADNAVRMQTSGSGLGLFIVKNIVERHGGKIWAESEEGEGTTFYLTVPYKDQFSPKTEEEKKFEAFIEGF